MAINCGLKSAVNSSHSKVGFSPEIISVVLWPYVGKADNIT